MASRRTYLDSATEARGTRSLRLVMTFQFSLSDEMSWTLSIDSCQHTTPSATVMTRGRYRRLALAHDLQEALKRQGQALETIWMQKQTLSFHSKTSRMCPLVDRRNMGGVSFTHPSLHASLTHPHRGLAKTL